MGMAKAIQGMVETEAWAQLQEFIGRMEDDTLRALDMQIHEHPVYLYNHGLVRGLRAAAEIADGIIEAGKRAEHELAAMNAARDNGDV